ncbi:MAG TPA: ATP phosphoribosyltransferase regulatory subunit, partial [Limnochordales bacterium]
MVFLGIITAPRGTADILPADARRWHELEEAARAVFDAYGYGEIRTPIFEHTELFQRGIGEATDVVDKEMYTFLDRGERSLTLRPEGTAGVVRAVLEHNMDKGALPIKLYYMGPMFRYERPQAGRARQFHQLGAECL